MPVRRIFLLEDRGVVNRWWPKGGVPSKFSSAYITHKCFLGWPLDLRFRGCAIGAFSSSVGHILRFMIANPFQESIQK